MSMAPTREITDVQRLAPRGEQTDLQRYFSLGLTNENDPIVDDVVINTIRTPPNTKSQSFNRVIFEIPKVGLLTKDSGIMVQPRQAADSSNTSSNVLVIGKLSHICPISLIIFFLKITCSALCIDIVNTKCIPSLVLSSNILISYFSIT